jgi:hypothetical protein
MMDFSVAGIGVARSPLRIGVMILGMAVVLAAPVPAGAQSDGSPRESAPIDLTGYWVSIVTEDWKYRMVTPSKGEYGGVPISTEGRRIADTWDPARDEAAGEQCKAYGAGAIMRLPGRFHIIWENQDTLRIDTDTGMQTRFFRFGALPARDQERTWQGYSAAQWQAPEGNLKIVTTHMRPGYLRKNGVFYSENAVVTEYYERIEAPDGEHWLIVTTIVEDNLYLNSPFVTSTHFRNLPDDSGWSPTPCSVR